MPRDTHDKQASEPSQDLSDEIDEGDEALAEQSALPSKRPGLRAPEREDGHVPSEDGPRERYNHEEEPASRKVIFSEGAHKDQDAATTAGLSEAR